MRITGELAEVKGGLTKEVEINLYRIVQESLNNILKHAHATEATVTLTRDANTLRLRITDNGRGFEASAPAAELGAGSGFGLAGMAERARMAGGQLEVTSRPGHGTTVAAWAPIRADAVAPSVES